MKKEVSRPQLEEVIKEMRSLEVEHPKANVLYDFESERITISYPLPPDFHHLAQYNPFTKEPLITNNK